MANDEYVEKGSFNSKRWIADNTVPVKEGNSDKYTWEQINNAFMAQGTSPKNIARFLSALKKQ